MIRRWWQRIEAPRHRIDERVWARVRRRMRHACRLDEVHWQALRALAEGFLASKSLSPVAGLQLDPVRSTLLAAQCCLPVLHLGADWLGGWRELVIYPGQFRVRRHEIDEDTGVASEWDDELAGEAWERGPVVLSWADVLADLRDPQPGFQVVAHEIAHKLDLSDGAMNGTPALPDAARRRAWRAAFQPAFEDLQEILDSGREPAIDAYAAESVDEFFAVTSEYHFTAPAVLAAAYPAVAEQLARYYGPSPAPG